MIVLSKLSLNKGEGLMKVSPTKDFLGLTYIGIWCNGSTTDFGSV